MSKSRLEISIHVVSVNETENKNPISVSPKTGSPFDLLPKVSSFKFWKTPDNDVLVFSDNDNLGQDEEIGNYAGLYDQAAKKDKDGCCRKIMCCLKSK